MHNNNNGRQYNSDFSLSNVDLNNFIKQVEHNGVNIVDTINIGPNTPINEIFSKRGVQCGHAVLFNGPNDGGHWIATLRNRDGDLYFMDSFAENPNVYSKNILKCYENNLKAGNIKSININKTVLQKDASQCCGRYAIVFCSLHKAGVEPSLMIDFLEDNKKKYGSVDNFIIELTKQL